MDHVKGLQNVVENSKNLGAALPNEMKAFSNLFGEVFKDGALTVKEKEYYRVLETYLKAHQSISAYQAQEILGMSGASVRRYLKKICRSRFTKENRKYKKSSVLSCIIEQERLFVI